MASPAPVIPQVHAICTSHSHFSLYVHLLQSYRTVAEHGLRPAKVSWLAIGVAEAVWRGRRVVCLSLEIVEEQLGLLRPPRP